ncbi:hypothetical protein D9758_006636 [Tetrapyrgos nigripes]|uniref:F-box domain-containing protein n=1 Tax=Tetrapyrgos nigripes TaxID=182062 RepID=A0A8H5LQP0_9AGAR|nr:hypothetical protein D9758_006636 [Tetrapyrgos nigripes]
MMRSLSKMPSSTALPTELIEEIVSYMVDVQNDSWFQIEVLTVASKRDLLSCALSCTAFFGPAMRTLWSTAELTRLLQLLPGLDWQLLPGLVVGSSCVLTDELTEVSLKRFDIYTSMVKTLVHHGDWRDYTSVCSSLALIRPRPLLSLKHVYFHTYRLTFSWSGEMMLMVSPVLKSAFFSFCSPSIMAYISIIKDEATMSDSLTISLTIPHARYANFDLACISQLQNLRFLHLFLDLSTVETGASAVSHPRHLKELRLDYDKALNTPKDVFTVLRIYRNSGVESFSLQGALQGVDIQRILNAMSSQWSRTLTTLSLNISINQWPIGKETFLDIIRPLRSLHKLQVFMGKFTLGPTGPTDWISAPPVIYITHPLIPDICNAWHNLVDLEIRTDGFENILAVASLAEHCPKLKRLSIPFDILAVPSIDDVQHRNTFPLESSHKLESITLMVKEGTDLEGTDFVSLVARGSVISRLAYLLDLTFPYLKEVSIRTTSAFRLPPNALPLAAPLATAHRPPPRPVPARAGWKNSRNVIMDVIRARQEARRLKGTQL